MPQEYRVPVDEGNFTFVAPAESEGIDILRYGKPWRKVEDPDLTWPLFALMCELHAAREVLAAARQTLKASTEDLAPIAELRRAVELHDRGVADHEATTPIASASNHEATTAVASASNHEAPTAIASASPSDPSVHSADETAALQGCCAKETLSHLEPTPKYDSALSVRLVSGARQLVTAGTGAKFPFPDPRSTELAIRLVAPGPKASAVSASECHEISSAVIHACGSASLPARALETITSLADQLKAAEAEMAALKRAPASALDEHDRINPSAAHEGQSPAYSQAVVQTSPGQTVNILILKCPAHRFMGVSINRLRITPIKCCGSWMIQRRWDIPAETLIADLERAALVTVPRATPDEIWIVERVRDEQYGERTHVVAWHPTRDGAESLAKKLQAEFDQAREQVWSRYEVGETIFAMLEEHEHALYDFSTYMPRQPEEHEAALIAQLQEWWHQESLAWQIFVEDEIMTKMADPPRHCQELVRPEAVRYVCRVVCREPVATRAWLDAHQPQNEEAP